MGVTWVGELTIDRIAGRVWAGGKRCKVTPREVRSCGCWPELPGKVVNAEDASSTKLLEVGGKS